MRRVSLFLTLFVFACENSQLPTTTDPGPISLAISDGTTFEDGGNPDFFFLPPIVPNPIDEPEYEAGEFNPYLAPTGMICKLADGVCADVIGQFDLELVADSTHYQYNWNTDDLNGAGLDLDTEYRINVYIGAPGNGGVLLGYRDVYPVPTNQEVPNDPETLPTYVFRYGSNIPIKVRIENGALCDPPGSKTCVTKAVNLSEGGSLVLTSTDRLDVPPQTDLTGQPTLTMQPCTDENGNMIDNLPIDIPTFGACFEIRALTADGQELELSDSAVVSLCSIDAYNPLNPSSLPPEPQDDLVTLHRWHGYTGLQGGSVEALPHAGGYCEGEPTFGIESVQGTGLVRYARILRDRVLSLVSPEPLHAKAAVMHRGMGGVTGSFSRFQFALPAKMTIYAGNNQVAPVSTAVPVAPEVLVTDLHGGLVAGATVHFSVLGELEGDAVDPISFETGADGIARVTSWTLGGAYGQYELVASGRGIADPGVNGPRGDDPIVWGSYGPDDPFMPFDTYAEIDDYYSTSIPAAAFGPQQLAEGQLTFTATACAPGYGSIDTGEDGGIDGVMEEGEWLCAKSVEFDANLSGGSVAPATLYWMNDGANLYLAVSVVRDQEDKVNSLRFEFDSDGLGRSEFDDVIMFDGGLQQFADMYLDVKCAGSKQASCGEIDSGGEAGQNGGGAQSYDGTRTVYELWHPLATGDTEDIALTEADPEIRLFLTLSLGKGAQGNTQWPAFTEYTSGAYYNIVLIPMQ